MCMKHYKYIDLIPNVGERLKKIAHEKMINLRMVAFSMGICYATFYRILQHPTGLSLGIKTWNKIDAYLKKNEKE